MRTLLLLSLAAIAGCTGDSAATANAARSRATDGTDAAVSEDADCNLQTPLVPGIPGSPGNLIKSTRNPNGDSELAVLMRRFVDDLRDVRTKLEAKEPLAPLYPTHRKMRCAWPTKPEERDQNYDNRAVGYLAAVRAFDREPGKATFNAIIDGCVHCHAQSCGGPLDFIDGMRWP
jgi:hypothetical protein